MNPSLHCWQGWLGRLIACCKNCVVHCVLEKSGLHGVSVRVPLGCVRNTYKWWVLPNEAVNYFPFQAFSLHHHFPLLPSIRPRIKWFPLLDLPPSTSPAHYTTTHSLSFGARKYKPTAIQTWGQSVRTPTFSNYLFHHLNFKFFSTTVYRPHPPASLRRTTHLLF